MTEERTSIEPPAGSRRPGLFLSFEGMDGSGKTTQMRLLIDRLRADGYDLLETAEPGGTTIGRQIRRILLDPANCALSNRAELLLYFACRAQNVDEWIRPALQAGRVVISDRFTDSTVAYQSAGRGLDESLVRQLHSIACGEVEPDLTIYLAIDRETGLARARARNTERAVACQPDETRIDDEKAEFHDRVRLAYERMAANEPSRFRKVDASPSVPEVAAAIWNILQPYLEAHPLKKAVPNV